MKQSRNIAWNCQDIESILRSFLLFQCTRLDLTRGKTSLVTLALFAAKLYIESVLIMAYSLQIGYRSISTIDRKLYLAISV